MLMMQRATRSNAAHASSVFIGRLRVRRAPKVKKSKNHTRSETNSGTDSVGRRKQSAHEMIGGGSAAW